MTNPISPDPIISDPVACQAQTLEHLRVAAMKLAGDAQDRAKAVGKQLVETVRTHPVHIDALNALLQGELSAIETYEQAMAKFGDESPIDLKHSLDSHRLRSQQITVRIYDLGGKPAETSGVWGTFAGLVEGGAALFGRKSALAALEEGEDHGLALYRDRLDDLDQESRSMAESRLLPEQMKSHDNMRNLHRNCP